MSTGYQIYDQGGCYYLTLQVVYWIDIFSRKSYRNILIDSLNYCIEHKGLRLHAYVIMSNHIHIIASAANNNLSDIVRDFKRHTSKAILNEINVQQESRREWMLKLFAHAAAKHERNTGYQIWTHENHAIEIFSAKFIKQKMEYIHQNPVRAGIVNREEDYVYSSATDYLIDECGVIKIELLH